MYENVFGSGEWGFRVSGRIFDVFLLTLQRIQKKQIMIIEISDAVLEQVPAYASPEDVKVDFAVWLYERERLTLAQAARLCGRTRLQFQKKLKERGVHLHYSVDDIQVDVQNM